MRNERPDTPVAAVWRQFGRNHLAVFALIMVLVLFGVAALADFIANDKPLVMKYQNRFYFPVLKDYAVRLGMTRAWLSRRANWQRVGGYRDADRRIKFTTSALAAYIRGRA